MATVIKDLGAVTAYAYAVEGGYTGTEEEFAALLGNIADDLSQIENLSVTVTTLPAGSSATASYSNGVLALGIPKGDKGDKGDTGATPAFTIGTVTTLAAGNDASASITGTAAAPVLNLGIPKGADGDVSSASMATAYSTSATYAVGDYVWYSGQLYCCTTAISTAESWTAAHWTAVKLAEDVGNLKSAFLRQTHPGDNVVTDLVFTQGGYYNSTDNDTYVANANWGYTDKIAITAGKTYFINTTVNYYISFYDSNGDFISGLAGVSATAPSNAAYIRLSVGKTQQPRAKLTVDAAYTDYVAGARTDISNLNIKYYFRNELMSSRGEREAALTKPSIGKISVVVRNTYNGENYAIITQYNSDDVQLTNYVQLMSAGEVITIDDFNIAESTAKVVVKNTTDANGVEYTMYHTILDAVEENIERVNSDVFIEMPKTYTGYLGADGVGHAESSGVNRYTGYLPASLGEQFIYSGSYSWSLVFGYYEDNTAVSLLPGGTYTDKILTIADPNVVKVRAWSDTSRMPLKFYSLRSLEAQVEETKSRVRDTYGTIVVDASGNGDFIDLGSAVAYAKSTYDVASYPVEIYIKDGIYPVSPTSASPFYAIDKGANRISIKGQSRDGTVIRCTCTDTLQGIALNIGGECTIENLTIENLADASFTSETILSGNHRPYCIHSDTPFAGNTKHYYTTIRNVKLYSECFCPLGAGLQNLQTLRLENVEAIYASNAVMIGQGAIYIHAPYSSAFVADGVQLIDCVMISENERPALVLPNVSGSQSMADLEQTFVRNVTASRGANEVSMSAPNNKTFWSKSNSNPALNA